MVPIVGSWYTYVFVLLKYLPTEFNKIKLQDNNMANESQKINKFIQFHYKYCSIGTYFFFFLRALFFVEVVPLLLEAIKMFLQGSQCFWKDIILFII